MNANCRRSFALTVGGLVMTVLIPATVSALSTDQRKPIQIEADRLDVDEQKGVSTYSGAVQYKQGSIVLTADKLTVAVAADGRLQKVLAEGSPATFQQTLDRDKQVLRGRATSVEFLADQQYMILTGDARISHCGDEFAGNRLEYWSDKELVKASKNADGKERVQVVLQPRTQDSANAASPVICAPISVPAK